jgi:hypothetical protein
MKGTQALVIAGAIVGTVLPFNLVAQQVASDEGALSEIVVTAERRAESVAKVPISISVYD